METKQILTKARKLIEDRKRWAVGTYFGNNSFCAVGAIAHTLGFADVYVDPVREVAAVLAEHGCGCPTGEVGAWNDRHTHAEVLAAFDRAIAAA